MALWPEVLLLWALGAGFGWLLLGLGLLFLAGGWGLERLRRRLLAAPRP